VEYLTKFRAKISQEAGPEPDLFPLTAAGGSPPTVDKVERGREPLPPWLKLKIAKGTTAYPNYHRLKTQMREKKLATVCEEARCPNIGECWGGGEGETATATIMLMGDECTRGCRFCSVKTRKAPKPLDPEEPMRVAAALADIGVEYIVLTMVDRDDIADGGASHVALTLQEIKKRSPTLLVECLVGDFRGKTDCVDTVVKGGLDVYAHNIECVERITPWVRDRRAMYAQSMSVLKHVKTTYPSMYTKSSIMLGLGERSEEIRQTMLDLRGIGVDFLTLGQYLQPDRSRMKVERYVHPDEFTMWQKEGEAMGFRYVASGPMVRSSYRAGEYFIKNVLKKDKELSNKGCE
jgi:lipoic acid synthetase